MKNAKFRDAPNAKVICGQESETYIIVIDEDNKDYSIHPIVSDSV